MINKFESRLLVCTLGLTMAVFSSNAFSGTGPVTFLWHNSVGTLLVAAGGVSCGMTPANADSAIIAGLATILASAKVSGHSVSMSCGSSGITSLSLL